MIHYRPKLDSELWERKSQQPFESADALKAYVAETETKHERYCWGEDVDYSPEDVTFERSYDIFEWKNRCNVIVGGRIVGYCGEWG